MYTTRLYRCICTYKYSNGDYQSPTPLPAQRQQQPLRLTCAAQGRGSAAPTHSRAWHEQDLKLEDPHGSGSDAPSTAFCRFPPHARTPWSPRPHRSAAGEGRAEDAVFFSVTPSIFVFLRTRAAPLLPFRSRAAPSSVTAPRRMPLAPTPAADPAKPRPAPRDADERP
jgi:hypothetical protein